MTDQEKSQVQGFKAAVAVIRRMAQERGTKEFWTAHDWLNEHGKARWEHFEDVPPL